MRAKPAMAVFLKSPKDMATTRKAAKGTDCPAIACRECGFYKIGLSMGLDSPDTALVDRYIKKRRMFKRGDVLYRSGEPFSHVYAIRSGSIKTYISTDDGRLQITGFHVAANCLG